MATVVSGLEEFIQELDAPTERVVVWAEAATAVMITLSGGKAVAVRVGTGSPLLMDAEAAGIDTVLVYTANVKSLRMCVFEFDTMADEAAWSQAPYIVTVTSVPIRRPSRTLASNLECELQDRLENRGLAPGNPRAQAERGG